MQVRGVEGRSTGGGYRHFAPCCARSVPAAILDTSEMATMAQAPFEGATAGLVYDAILNREQPTSPRSINLNARRRESRADRSVSKPSSFRSDRENRYQKCPGARQCDDLRRLKRDTGSVPDSYPKVATPDQRWRSGVFGRPRSRRRQFWLRSTCLVGNIHSVASCPWALYERLTIGSLAVSARPSRANTRDDREQWTTHADLVVIAESLIPAPFRASCSSK